MKLNRIDHTPFAHRVGRYHFQMAQARLNTPVEPVFTYSLQPFYARQQEWLTELSHSLSRLYRFTAELNQAARQFATLDIHARENEAGVQTGEGVDKTEELFEMTSLLVFRYNRLHAFLNEHDDILSTEKLDTFERITRAVDGPLQQFGLKREQDGRLQVDEAQWRYAVQTDYAGFVTLMQGVGRHFREELLRLQTSPLGSFTRPYADARSANPYVHLSVPSLQYQYAAAAGVYLDMRF